MTNGPHIRVNRHSELAVSRASMTLSMGRVSAGAVHERLGPAPFPTTADEDADGMGEEGEPGTGQASGTASEPAVRPARLRLPGFPGRQAREPGDLLPMKWLGVGLPILLLVAIECFRYLVVEDSPMHRAEHVAIAAITAIGIVLFALVMFSLVERAERHIVRQNRELTAINAVSTAVQGELAVEQLIDAALQTVIDRTNATEASVVVFAHEGAPDSGVERSVVRTPHAPAAAIGYDLPHLIDIPLARGTAIVGRMRLHMPEGTEDPDVLTSATLQNIGHQLACSIQIGQLVDDLQRRKLEGHGLYDILLSISNQRPLLETLAAVVRHARELLQADDARIVLTPASAALLDGPLDPAAERLADGSVCIVAVRAGATTGGGRSLAPAVTPGAGSRSTMAVTLASPDLHLGDIRVDRAPDAPFNHRQLGFLQTLGGLATIALTNARMRENERQNAILVERERIAREMHDSLAQVLGVIHLRLRALGNNARSLEAPELAVGLGELADTAEEAYRDVREAILGLRESSHSGRSLIESLRGYVDKYQRQSGIQATLETDFDVEPRLSPRAEVQVIRVIQEALTNVRKHAAASATVVRVTTDDGFVTFRIEDDGRGFDPARRLLDRDAGYGLHSMRERMESIGGTLAVEAAPGRGTTVVAQVPALPGASPVAPEVDGAHGRFETVGRR